MSLSCQSLNVKFHRLCLFLKFIQNKVEVICPQETSMEYQHKQLWPIQNLKLQFVAECGKAFKHGGLITYIRKKNTSNKKTDHQTCTEQ